MVVDTGHTVAGAGVVETLLELLLGPPCWFWESGWSGFLERLLLL
jgi:hypothetical protein